jgi:hypothetical protein
MSQSTIEIGQDLDDMDHDPGRHGDSVNPQSAIPNPQSPPQVPAISGLLLGMYICPDCGQRDRQPRAVAEDAYQCSRCLTVRQVDPATGRIAGAIQQGLLSTTQREDLRQLNTRIRSTESYIAVLRERIQRMRTARDRILGELESEAERTPRELVRRQMLDRMIEDATQRGQEEAAAMRDIHGDDPDGPAYCSNDA